MGQLLSMGFINGFINGLIIIVTVLKSEEENCCLAAGEFFFRNQNVSTAIYCNINLNTARTFLFYITLLPPLLLACWIEKYTPDM